MMLNCIKLAYYRLNHNNEAYPMYVNYSIKQDQKAKKIITQ